MNFQQYRDLELRWLKVNKDINVLVQNQISLQLDIILWRYLVNQHTSFQELILQNLK